MFYKLIKVLPTAICGLALGIASLSNLLFNMSWYGLAVLFFILSCIILVLFIKKCILYPHTIYNELSDRHICTTFPTFPMALMTIIYIIKHHLNVNLGLLLWLWWLTIIIQFIIIAGFIYYHLILHNKGTVLPNTSWFVTFVGIGVIAETAKEFNPVLGEFTVYIATFCFIILIAIILIKKTWRLYNENQFPMSIIIAAPAALCLNGFLISAKSNDIIIMVSGFIISQLLFMVSLTFIPKLMAINFKFLFAALTFPWVTTATAYFNFMIHVRFPSVLQNLLQFMLICEIIFALLAVVYVILGYIVFLRKRINNNVF